MAKVLVTAGATQVDIDRVRAITNVFRGTTGCRIAAEAARRGHQVTLLCSDPSLAPSGVRVVPFRTFDDLRAAMEWEVTEGDYDVVVHSAAVSDYAPVRVTINPVVEDGLERGGKIGSSHPSLWIELRPTEKLLDLVRTRWHFTGKLAMFKLEVGKSDAELVELVQKRLAKSGADVAAANCLEWFRERALVIDASTVTEVPRADLDARLLERLGL